MSRKLGYDESYDDLVERYAPYWETLSQDDRQLAEKITMLTEYAGGRSVSARAMGVAPTTLDNYRMGKTQPKFLELLRLARAAEHSVDYLLAGTDFWELAHPEGNVSFPSAGPEIDEDLFVKVSKMVSRQSSEQGIRLSGDGLMKSTVSYYNALTSRAEDPHDLDEVESLLPWLEKKIAKDIQEARTAPGTGKREVS